MTEYATRAESFGYPVMGVIGFSVLNKLPHFNVVDCLVFDAMHGVDLGVMRQLASLWFSTCNSGKRYGISVNQFMKLMISFPKYLSHLI